MHALKLFIVAGVCLLGAFYARAADELLVFGADWCPSCVKLKAVLSSQPELAAGYHLVIVDIDQEPELAARYQVRAVPVLVVLQANGKLRRTVGFTTIENLRQWLKNGAIR